ncbi:hypothetical protein WMY93_031090 [Mugilogobius chulae]|uniref:Asteroid domain-containing protein n=1 Tax=Mugilogobius chulae TaxID=88201 RepID=A0AAW0MH65_9GOBI
MAPFDLVECSHFHDWILIDHMIMVYRVKESDYINGDTGASVVNMARTMATFYIQEFPRSGFVVLVKDGCSAPKPAVRESRTTRVLGAHVAFCKQNLAAIEYVMMAMLADEGMKDRVCLVTGSLSHWQRHGGFKNQVTEMDKQAKVHAVQGGVQDTPVISYHLEYLTLSDDKMLFEAAAAYDGVSCQVGADSFWYARGSIDRPVGWRHAFVATFADPDIGHVLALRDACSGCTCIEADTLLVSLANVLSGSIMVCTGDSDLIAVLTACGRKDITLRLENRTYRKDRYEAFPTFCELSFSTMQNQVSHTAFKETESCNSTNFWLLLDVSAAENACSLERVRCHHGQFDAALTENYESDTKNKMYEYLFSVGLRGPLYHTFLQRLLDLGISNQMVLLESCMKRRASCVSLFDTLSAQEASADSCDEKPKGFIKRVSSIYMRDLVPFGTFGRYLKLTELGNYLSLRLKEDVWRDEKKRLNRVLFMALCGTDYNYIPQGLGIRRLLSGIISNHRAFLLWCRDFERALWGECDAKAKTLDMRLYSLGMALAGLCAIPGTTVSKHWTMKRCALMCKNIKYVCDLWMLKSPKPGPEYGFVIHDEQALKMQSRAHIFRLQSLGSTADPFCPRDLRGGPAVLLCSQDPLG